MDTKNIKTYAYDNYGFYSLIVSPDSGIKIDSNINYTGLGNGILEGGLVFDNLGTIFDPIKMVQKGKVNLSNVYFNNYGVASDSGKNKIFYNWVTSDSIIFYSYNNVIKIGSRRG